MKAIADPTEINAAPDSPHAPPAARPVWGRAAWVVVLLAWLAAALGGLHLLRQYEATPGAADKALDQWPAASSMVRGRELPTLVMFAHPRCPCTRASIAELATLLTHHQNQIDARVCFFQPADATEDWSDTALCAAAAAIPGVKVEFDRNNVEAQRFGARTSGHTLLFDREGKLLFSGGITAARGHVGDNDGRTTIETLLTGGPPALDETQVFGCPLADPDAPAEGSPVR